MRAPALARCGGRGGGGRERHSDSRNQKSVVVTVFVWSRVQDLGEIRPKECLHTSPAGRHGSSRSGPGTATASACVRARSALRSVWSFAGFHKEDYK